MTTLEIIEQYAREQRRRALKGQRGNYYWHTTALSKRIEGRVEACETILARMTKEQT
jgi:hypothetical protein